MHILGSQHTPSNFCQSHFVIQQQEVEIIKSGTRTDEQMEGKRDVKSEIVIQIFLLKIIYDLWDICNWFLIVERLSKSTDPNYLLIQAKQVPSYIDIIN